MHAKHFLAVESPGKSSVAFQPAHLHPEDKSAMMLLAFLMIISGSTSWDGFVSATPSLVLSKGDNSPYPARSTNASEIVDLSSHNTQVKLPVLATNAGGEIPFRVPGTETTLLLSLQPSADPHLRPAILRLLSYCLTDVENIIDVAGDGVIPGPDNMYSIILRETHVTVEFLALGHDPKGPTDQMLTYMVLFNALKGLWTFFYRERRWLSLDYFKINQDNKGVLAMGYIRQVK
ncbi:MAG: hypothetical protein Q9201_004478 [Fulgogasparrea decipioides]